MARNYANISTAIWRDDDFRALTVGAQHAYFLLATQPDISAAGVLPLTLGRWASRAEDSTIDTLELALAELAARRFIVIDRDSQELLVRSFVKWDGGYSNSKRRFAIRDAAEQIESDALRRALAAEFERLDLPVSWIPAFSQVDSLSMPYTENEDGPSGNPGWPTPENSDTRRVVVTKALVVDPQPSTRIPQPPTRADEPPRGAAAVLIKPDAVVSEVALDGWGAKNTQPRTEGPRVPRQPSLFDVRRSEIEKLPQATRLIGAWMQSNGYPNASGADCLAVHQAVIRQHPEVKDMLAYLRGIASRGGFMDYYQPILDERADRIGKQIQILTEGQPDCGHGFPGGDLPHPTTGLALCPSCRGGRAPQVKRQTETTHPDVRAALSAYRTAYREAFGTGPLLPLLMTVTAEAELIRQQNVAPQEITAVAAEAGRTGASLLETARSLKGVAA